MHIILLILIIFVLLAIVYTVSIIVYPLSSLYYQFFKPTAKMDNLDSLDILYQILGIILKYCDHTSIKIWPVYGTLLGIVRDNELICYDVDVDLGIDSRDFKQMITIIQKVVKENNQYAYIVFNKPIGRYIRLFHKETNLNCDISIYNKNELKYERVLLNKETTANEENDIHLVPKTISYKGKTYNLTIPENSRELLVMWYGDDYMTPSQTCDEKCQHCQKTT